MADQKLEPIPLPSIRTTQHTEHQAHPDHHAFVHHSHAIRHFKQFKVPTRQETFHRVPPSVIRRNANARQSRVLRALVAFRLKRANWRIRVSTFSFSLRRA